MALIPVKSSLSNGFKKTQRAWPRDGEPRAHTSGRARVAARRSRASGGFRANLLAPSVTRAVLRRRPCWSSRARHVRPRRREAPTRVGFTAPMRLAPRGAMPIPRAASGWTPSARDARAIAASTRARGVRARGLRRRRDADLDVVLRAPRESVHVESRRTRRRSWRDGRDARHHANLGVRLRLRPRDGVVPRGVQIRTVRAGVRRFDPPAHAHFPPHAWLPPRPFATSSAPALRHPLTPRSRRPTPTRPQEYVRGTRPVLRHHPHGTPPPRP